MANDAKLGLVCGVCLIFVVAVMFFHDDLVPTEPPTAENAPTIATHDDAPDGTSHSPYRTVKSRHKTRHSR